MKNRAGVGVALIVVVSLICFAARGFGQGTGGKVEIKGDYIIVHPGTKLSKPDAKALDDVLKQYATSLYKIEVYNRGQTSSTSGTLLDMCVDQRTVAELTQAKSQGQSERAIQLIAPQTGSAVNPTTSISGSPTPGSAVNPNTGSPTPGAVPVNPTMSPVNPTMSPVNPTRPTDEAGSPVPSGTQTPTPTGTQAAVNPQVAVNPTANTQPCGVTDPKANEFLQRVKPILEKYSR